jgi:hypothetical protein
VSPRGPRSPAGSPDSVGGMRPRACRPAAAPVAPPA